MSDTDDKPRSALEIAMDRLKQRDAESGVVDRPPTEEQKSALAEARNVHAAKMAELEILQRSKMAGVMDRVALLRSIVWPASWTLRIATVCRPSIVTNCVV